MNNSSLTKKSNWIWTEAAYDESNPSIVYFRKELMLEQDVKSAVIRVSADSRYRLYVNDTSMAQGPCKGDRNVWYYDEVDIKNALHQGVNVFAVVVLRYPQNLKNKINHSMIRTEVPGFYLAGTIMLVDGEVIPFTADETWKSFYEDKNKIGRPGVYNDYLDIAETIEGDQRTLGWKRPGFSDMDWSAAKVYLERSVNKVISPGCMGPRPIPFLYEKPCAFESVVCVRTPETKTGDWERLIRQQGIIVIPENKKEVVEISAGVEETGFLEMAFAGGKGAKVSILTSEAYVYGLKNKNGHPVKKDRTDYVHGHLEGIIDIYTVGGYGTLEQPEEYEPFWFRTFRFIQITVETGSQPLAITKFFYRETGYPLEVKTKVETSDESLRAVWEISERTLRRCMHETYIDCPFYEQLQYAMDSRSQILFTYNIAADDRLARKCIDDLFRSQGYDGLTYDCYPSYSAHVIPGFSIYYILMIYDHMMYFGDKKLVEKYMPSVMRVLQFFDNRLEENGLISRTSEGGLGSPYWSYIDWTVQWNVGVPNAIYKGPVTMESLLYRMGLQAAAKLASYIDLPDMAVSFTRKSEVIKQAILTHCVGRDGLIQDGPGFEEYSQHAQVFAILTDVVTGTKAKEIMEVALVDDSLAQCSVAMAFYLYRALEKVGLYEKTERLWELWREMVNNNLTTCVEDGVNERSDCHAWGALILYELPAIVLGVQPAEPGYESIKLNPNPGYLSWAKGEVITPKGLVKVSWKKKKDGEIAVEVEAPKGMKIAGRKTL